MSIEYLGTPESPILPPVVATLFDRLIQDAELRSVRRTESELGAIANDDQVNVAETMTVSITPEEVYLAFHVATRDQRLRVLQVISRLLQDHGVACHLEEQ